MLINNPLIEKSKLKHGAIPFDDIKLNHFIPALDYAISKADKIMNSIKNSSEIPTFDNTALEMENSTRLIEIIANTYYNLMSAESDNKFKELAQEISPKLSIFNNKIFLDSKLFDRIKILYNNREEDNLTSEQKRLIEEKYKEFVLNGALLNDKDKKKIRLIDEELSKLSPKFSQNTLNSTNEFIYHTVDEHEISGLPYIVKEQAAETAKKKNKKSGWIFTLQMPSYFPIMQYADNRMLRETFFKARGKISFGGKYDNQKIIKTIISLRSKKAKILGFKEHADYTLQKRMAGSTKNVNKFLDRLYEVYYPAAKKELEEIRGLAKKDGIDDLQSWDVAYYSEKLKNQKYGFDQEKLRPYFKVENVIDGIFKVAEMLYGLHFTEINDVPVYHKEVRVFEVKENNGDFVSLFYIDLHPRETKRSGAWMTCYRSQGLYNGNIERPLISIVANLTPSTEGNPSLLTFDEVETVFHEFGHALHGMLSNVTYSSLASPDVYWDFVELPSQIMENWLGEEETLKLFAKHYDTQKNIPDELIKKIKASKAFNKGLWSLRQLSLGFLDMAWHTTDPQKIENIQEFEKQTMEKTRLLPEVKDLNISCSFGHIFAGGYSAGYYSYKWAEALDADAFEFFKEKGIFNKNIANSFRKNILEKGNTEPPMELYKNFRGKAPDPDAMFRRDQIL